MKAIRKSFQYGEHTVTLEAGAIARQADGAVIDELADTAVLVTAVGRKSADPGRDFFPLTVNYQEKTYAAGKIPGGFFKREGRPSEKETLICRLLDCRFVRCSQKHSRTKSTPLRPLFRRVPEVDVHSGVDRRICRIGNFRYAFRRADRCGESWLFGR
ncbi:MAG: hypothetical protein U5K38_19080 [Woeseiaceae bacterium]|nr:hypothetical protein [Woeseiaceae bacterium]